jgi:thioredoxin reductase
MGFREVSKETLLALWYDVMEKTGLRVRYGEPVERIAPIDGGFAVTTRIGVYPTRAVLLAIGRRGSPRKLGVPGEEQAKVVYRLIDPEQYRGQHVLVVGGGDSALEATASLAGEPGTSVTLAYRSKAFARAKPKNRQRVEQLARDGRLQLFMETNVTSIGPQDVQLERRGEPLQLRNDAVIVCAGGILPTRFLEETGIAIDKKFGTI